MPQDFFSCSRKKLLLRNKKILRQEKNCFVTEPIIFSLASEIISEEVSSMNKRRWEGAFNPRTLPGITLLTGLVTVTMLILINR